MMKKHELHEERHTQRMMHYQSADINDKLIMNLRDLSHVMRSLYEGKGSQKRILIVLNEVGTITQRTLTERLGIQPGSVSEVIAKLESAGLVSRMPSDADRRTADISLTREGKELAVQAAEKRKHRHEEMFSCLSSDEKAQLLLLLEKVNTDWEQRYRNIEKTRDPGRDHHGHCGHHGGVHRPE
ncbi:MAG: MarR family winged helix-turn-helix transcriptional regulator [Acutalibacteraceae bacterium]